MLFKKKWLVFLSFLIVINVGFYGYGIEETEKKQVEQENIQSRKEPQGRKIKKPGFGDIIEKLNNKKTKLRLSAVQELGRIGTGEVVPFLIKVLDDRKVVVRLAGVEALEKIGGEEAIKGLVKALNDKNKKVRLFSVNSLVRIAGKQAIPSLKRRLSIEKDRKIRFSIVNVFAAIGDDEVVSVLVEALRDPDIKIRLISVNTLAVIGTPLAVAALANSLESGLNKEKISIAIIDTLGVIHSRDAVPVLIRIAKNSPKSKVRLAAIKSLGNIEDKRAIPVLNELLTCGDKELNEPVSRAIRKILKRNALLILKKQRIRSKK